MMNPAAERKPLFERLKSALEEGRQFAKGRTELRVMVVVAPPPDFHAEKIIRLRQRFNLSQRVFAQTLNVSTRTVQSWEQGSRRPSQAAIRLLQLLDERPELVCEIVGITAPRHSANSRKVR